MADPSMQPPNIAHNAMIDTNWRTQEFRQKVVANIEEAMRLSGTPIQKSSIEMETHVFQKAKTREEYLALVAKLILYVKENVKKKDGLANAANFNGGASTSGLLNLNSDPINALQNLAKINLPSRIVPQGPLGHMPNQQNIAQGPNAALQMGMQQRPQFGSGSGGGYPQNQQQAMQNRVQQGMIKTEMYAMQQQQRPMGVPGPGGQPQGVMQQSGQFGGMMGGNMPMQMHQFQIQQMRQQGPNGMPGPFTVPVGPGGPNQMVGPINSPVGGNYQMTGPAGNIPSPAALMPSPGAPNSAINPSPARLITGAPSPGMINTPGNPGSVGSGTGIAGSGGSGGARLTPAEEQAYMEKWKQLQKYIEPLKRMINRIDKDEDRQLDLNKMKNLLGILSDSSKRLPIQTLLKCEEVLEKQLQFPNKPPGLQQVPPLEGPSEHMCQPLLDAIAAHIKSPMLNHTLQRTFGPAVRALHGPPLRVDSPPPKRQRVDDIDDGCDIPDIIQGEVARLHSRFIVNLDSSHHSGSKVVQLLCKLEDKNLPSVPPIVVSLPESYPHASPSCKMLANYYDSTPFLEKIQEILMSEIDRNSGNYSLTALLNLWDISIRKACEPLTAAA